MNQLNDLSPGELRLTCATLQDEVARLGEALKDAAQSLETISQNAGTNEYMKELSEVRGYAGSRASVARVALGRIKPS